MSKFELWKLIAPLSPQERCELRQMLDEMPELLAPDAPRDPLMQAMALIESRPPMPVPPDFGVNHDHYLHGGEKREP